MIALDSEQHLGKKALALFIFRTTGIVIVLLALDAVFIGTQDELVKNTMDAFGSVGPGAFTQTQVSFFVSYVIAGLLLLSVIIFFVGIVVAYLQYRFYTFTVEEFNLKLKRGILYREEISIPYRQMQDINILRSLFYQILGLSRIIIDSAGNEEYAVQNETDIIIEPLDVGVALELRTLLQRRIGIQVVQTDKEADTAEAKGTFSSQRPS